VEIYYQYLNALVEKGRNNDTPDNALKVMPIKQAGVDKFNIDPADRAFFF
jgi:hypothetical protein